MIRKTLPSLKATALRDVIEILEKTKLGEHCLYELVKHQKTENYFTYKKAILEFFCLDDEQKVRSRKRDNLWIVESNEITYHEWQQLIFRTSGNTYLDFNPDDEDIWINTQLEQKRALEMNDVDVIKSTYKDNPFLSEGLIKEIEYLKETDPASWQIYGLGEYGKLTGLIFQHTTGDVPEGADLIAYGLDFGYSNHPTAMTAVYRKDEELYFDELIYEKGLTNQDISSRMEALQIDRNKEIIADSAEPKSIEEIYRLGWNIKPAKKGADSIKNSIDVLKRFSLTITERSFNIRKEFRGYKWAEDKNGNLLKVPVDFNNHAIDGIRYVGLNKLAHDTVGQYEII